MFSIKHSTEPNPTNVNSSTALPNTYGKIRTLKGDFENFQTGKKESADEALPTDAPLGTGLTPSQELERAVAAALPISGDQVPPASSQPLQPQPVAMPAPPVAQENGAEKTGSLPSPLGSNDYFADKSPFEAINEAPRENTANVPPKKKSGSLFVILLSFLFLVVLGGGFYYYWFFVKKPAPSQTAAPKTTQATTPSGKKILALTVDPVSGNEGFKQALQKMAGDFLLEASENNLSEARLVGKDNQQLPVKDFISVSLLNLPETVTQRFSSDDYSLFLKKENGEVRAGIVFALSDPTSVPEELLGQEKNLSSQIKFLYLNQTLPGIEPVFSSSKYKNADIRYYNFSSPLNTSLDYSVIKGKTGGYLIMATSKETIRSIMDYMSSK
jgi:flagellar basal body-associated protein FliL